MSDCKINSQNISQSNSQNISQSISQSNSQNISQSNSSNNSTSSSNSSQNSSRSKFKFSNTAQNIDIPKRKTKHVEMFLDKERLKDISKSIDKECLKECLKDVKNIDNEQYVRDVSRNLDSMITGQRQDTKTNKTNTNNNAANNTNTNNGFTHILQTYDKTYDNIYNIYSPICENTPFKNDFCKTDLYGNDVFKNDFYKPDLFKPEFYKPEFYKGDVYKGDICKGDVYKPNFLENPFNNNPFGNAFTNDIQKQQQQYQKENQQYQEQQQQPQYTTDIEPFAIPPGLDQQFMLPIISNFASNTPFDASNSSTALQETGNTANVNTNVTNTTVNTNIAPNTTTANTTNTNIAPNTTTNTTSDTSIKLWKPQTKTPEWEIINKFVEKAVTCLNMMKNLNGMYSDRPNYTKQDVFDFWRYTLYQAALKHEIPQRSPILHHTYIRDENQNTIAMLLAKNMQQIPDYWTHSPTLTNVDQETVAIIQAKRGIIPSEKWYHKNTMADKNKHTVLMSLVIKWTQMNKINYDALYTENQDSLDTENYNSIQTIYTINQDKLNKMISERQANFENWFSQIPQHWFHNAATFDYFGNTVALILAQNGIIPPKSICHKPDLKNCYKQRVVDYLFWYRLKIPAEWMVVKVESAIKVETQVPVKMETQMSKIENQFKIKIVTAKNQKQKFSFSECNECNQNEHNEQEHKEERNDQQE